MRKIILLNLLFFSVALLQGQSVEKKTRDAIRLLEQENYMEAIQLLRNAVSAIEKERLNAMEADLFPEKVSDYVKVNGEDTMKSSSSNISGNRIELIQVYTKPGDSSDSTKEEFAGPDNSSITVSISNVPGKMYEIANVHSNSMNELEGFESESLASTSFKGYRAASSYNPQAGYGRFSVIVGGAVLEIKAENIKTEKQLIETAEKIDLDKVIQLFGR